MRHTYKKNFIETNKELLNKILFFHHIKVINHDDIFSLKKQARQ